MISEAAMTNDTLTPIKPLSKRDKFLGYGCLFPLMVCGALAFLSDFFKGKKEVMEEGQTIVVGEVQGGSSMLFKAKDAQYILDTAGNLFNEVQNVADESYANAELSKELSERIKHLRVKQRALSADIISSGYDPRLRSVGTVRDELYLALIQIGQTCKIAEEMAMSKTDDARRLAGELAREKLKKALDHLGKAHAMLRMMDAESGNDML